MFPLLADRPTISCIIPAYNAGAFIDDAIDSVRQQTLPVGEIIVVDDASTDDTCERARAHDDVILLTSETNGGAARARNVGADRASGDLLAFLDADDIWLPHKIETQVATLKQHSDWGAVVANVQTFWQEGLEDEARRFEEHRIRQPMVAFGGSAILVRRDVFFHCGALDDELRHTDFQQWGLRARELGCEVGVVDDVLSRRRIHADNTSRVKAQESTEEFFQLLKRKLDRERSA